MPAHEISRTETLTTNTVGGKSTTDRKVVIRLAITGEDDVYLPYSSKKDRKFHPESMVMTVTDDEGALFDGVILTGGLRKKDGTIGTMSGRRIWDGFESGSTNPMPTWLLETVADVLKSIEWYVAQ